MREVRLMKKKYGVLLVDKGSEIVVYFLKEQSQIPIVSLNENGIPPLGGEFLTPGFKKEVSCEQT
jgi:hypothetical protein